MISCVDGKLSTTLYGDRIVAEFIEILNNDVDRHYPARRRNHNSLIGSRGLVIQHNHRTLRRIPAGIGHSELNQVQSRPFHKVDGRLRIGRDLQDRGLFAALHDRVKILQGAHCAGRAAAVKHHGRIARRQIERRHDGSGSGRTGRGGGRRPGGRQQVGVNFTIAGESKARNLAPIVDRAGVQQLQRRIRRPRS
jgi:hypothetical protein